MWNRKPKPMRPIGHWKNGKTLFGIWAGGTFLILSASLAALYRFNTDPRDPAGTSASANPSTTEPGNPRNPGFNHRRSPLRRS